MTGDSSAGVQVSQQQGEEGEEDEGRGGGRSGGEEGSAQSCNPIAVLRRCRRGGGCTDLQGH